MSMGPDQPITPEREAKVVRIVSFSILTCSKCERDCLFALVEELPNPRQFNFCTSCGQYFPIEGKQDEKTD